MSSKVCMTLTIEQANAVVNALDTYARLCIGQIECVADLVRDGTIPLRADSRAERIPVGYHAQRAVEEHLDQAKQYMGYPSNGSNGIGHPHVHVTGHRAWEVRKALQKALAVHHDPNPSFRGVDYDGIIVRYTQDPLPVAVISPSES